MNKKALKRVLSLICMLLFSISLTACSSNSSKTIDTTDVKQQSKQEFVDAYEESIKLWVVDFLEYLDETSASDLVEDANSNQTLYDTTQTRYIINYYGFNDATIQLYNSWNATREELGALKAIDIASIDIEVSEETGELCVISVEAAYEKNDKVVFEFTIDKNYYVSGAAINPTYTTAQKLAKAGMNTLIGMGTVFVVLVFISFIISLFKYINKFQNKNKKELVKEPEKEPENVTASVSEQNLADDYELVAVISAAIAAYEGEASSNGLVVRSIRRVR